MPPIIVTEAQLYAQIQQEALHFRHNHKYLDAVKTYMELARMARHEYDLHNCDAYIQQAKECFLEAAQWFNWNDYANQMLAVIQEK